jgi:hypothetical protein
MMSTWFTYSWLDRQLLPFTHAESRWIITFLLRLPTLLLILFYLPFFQVPGTSRFSIVFVFCSRSHYEIIVLDDSGIYGGGVWSFSRSSSPFTQRAATLGFVQGMAPFQGSFDDVSTLLRYSVIISLSFFLFSICYGGKSQKNIAMNTFY